MNDNNGKKLSKRAKLIISNIAVLCIVLIAALVQLFVFKSIDLVTYISTVLGFVLLSLVVYYISIIADALKERNKIIKKRLPEDKAEDMQKNN